jgi:hypothetical protein
MTNRLSRSLLTLAPFVLSLLALTSLTSATPPQSPNAKIFVDPDLQLSHDGDVSHMESYIAASATDPNFLLAAGEQIIPGRGLFSTQAQIYISITAGARWSPVSLPNEINGGWDNAVAGGADGTAYFLTSNFERGLTVYHTADAGKTWNSSVIAGSHGWDRPHIGIDLTAGQFKNRLYVAAEGEDGVEILSSDDSAKTFSAPVLACRKPDNWNAATGPSPFVLSDGTLVVPCSPYPNDPIRATWTDAEAGIVTSLDGGRNFTPFHRVAIAHRLAVAPMYAVRARGDVLISGNFMAGPSYAAGTAGTKFADRIYAVWQDVDAAQNSTILISSSADHGATWSTPAPVDPVLTADPHENSIRRALRQSVPMIAVNRDGVVGVAWFDGRNAPANNGYDVYFTASLDGASTFLPAARVSTATSIPARGLNVAPSAEVSKSNDSPDLSVQLVSPFSQRATGGDYATMAVDAAGRFHPLWPDARPTDTSGAWQLYTASIHVLTEKSPEAVTLAREASAQNSPAASVCAAEATQLDPIFEQIKWDAASNEILAPVRLLNNSTETLTSPIEVHVTLDLNSKSPSHPPALTPKLFDPTRSSFSDATSFTYSLSLSSPLFPLSVTPAHTLRLRAPAPHFLDFSFKLHISGSDCPAK